MVTPSPGALLAGSLLALLAPALMWSLGLQTQWVQVFGWVVTYMQHSRAASRSQIAPRMHILVCICSNVRQFIMLIIMIHIGVPSDVCRPPFGLFCQHLSVCMICVCRSTAYVLLLRAPIVSTRVWYHSRSKGGLLLAIVIGTSPSRPEFLHIRYEGTGDEVVDHTAAKISQLEVVRDPSP